jgi:hypothetical protein
MAGLLDYQQPEQSAPGTLGNLTPQQIGLLNAGLSMLSAPKYASIGNGLVRGTSLGERVGPGIQQGLTALQQAQQDQHERAIQQAQMAQSFVKAKQEQDKLAKQEMLHKELGSLDVNDINGLKKVLLKYSTNPAEILKSLLPDANKSTYEFLNTDQGIVKGNKSTGAIERAMLDNAIVRNSNASPELQGQIASAKTHGSEMQKLFKTTDSNGNEIFPTGAEVSNGNDIYSRIADAVLPNLIQTESSGNPNAVSPKGAIGLTQVMPETAANPGYGVKPMQDNSPEEQKRFGRDYLAAMLKANGGDIHKALSAYNAGQGNQAAAGDYSRKVFGQSEAQKQQIKTDAAIEEFKAKETAKQEIAQNDPIKLKAASDLNGILDSLSGHYDALDKINAIQNPRKGVIDNLKAGLASSDIGQYIANKAGTPGASERNSIDNIRSTLVPVIMKASGMTGSQINSDAELQQFLKSLTNPKGDIKSVKEQIDLIRKRYAGGADAKPTDNGGWSIKRVK